MKSLVKIGIAGLGIGRGHFKEFSSLESALVTAVCDIDEQRLEEVIEQYQDYNPSLETYTSFEAMLEKASLDAVVIALPNKFHKPYAIQAMKNGQHVLVEKPIAKNAADAKKMVEVSNKFQKILTVGHHNRYRPEVKLIRKMVESNELGRILRVSAVWIRREGTPSGWFVGKGSAGGGPLIDIGGSHALDLALWLSGLPEVYTVSGHLTRGFYSLRSEQSSKEHNVEDFNEALIRIRGGYVHKTQEAVVHLKTSWAAHIKEDQFYVEILGSRSGLRYQIIPPQEHPIGVFTEKHGAEWDNYPKKFESTPSLQEYFVQTILDPKKPILSPGEHGVYLMKVIDAIYKSAQQKREVKTIIKI